MDKHPNIVISTDEFRGDGTAIARKPGESRGPRRSAPGGVRLLKLLLLTVWSTVLLSGLATFFTFAGEREARAAFAAALSNDAALTAFLKEMPKGGELHTHLAGAVYAESWLQAAVKGGLFFDPDTGVFVNDPGKGRLPADKLFADSEPLRTWLNRVSLRGLAVVGKTGHDHFFDAFELVGPAVKGVYPVEDMLVEIIRRARAQNVQYQEIMAPVFTAEDQRRLVQGAPTVPEDPGEGDLERAFLQIQPKLDAFSAAVKRCLDDRDPVLAERLGIPAPSRGVVPFGFRYIYSINRFLPPTEFFALAAGGLAAIRSDPRVVGLTILAPEDHPLAARHFRSQMKILDFLWRKLERPNLALHAGELTLDISPLEAMQDRIRTSIEQGHARRIGHGVSVMWEDDLPGLFSEMRRLGVCVEICLSSNRAILGVAGKAHPFRLYRSAGIPLCLNTDDEGVSRTNLTREFLLAVREQDATYDELKDLVRNSLEFSFLGGESLYLDHDPARLAAGFSAVRDTVWRPDAGVLARVEKSPRLQALVALERAFVSFEARFDSGNANPVSRKGN